LKLPSKKREYRMTTTEPIIKKLANVLNGARYFKFRSKQKKIIGKRMIAIRFSIDSVEFGE
jgi:hypothetical protein